MTKPSDTKKDNAGEKTDSLEEQREGRRGIQFPWKLHELLEQSEKTGDDSIISWLPGGKAFKVHKKEEFCNEVMPAFFNSSKYKTFQRSLNLWGFESVVRGPDKGACYHRFFVRGHPDLCKNMMRVKIKGSGPPEAPNAASAPTNIPQKPLTSGFPGLAQELPAAAALTKLASSTCAPSNPAAAALAKLGSSTGAQANPAAAALTKLASSTGSKAYPAAAALTKLASSTSTHTSVPANISEYIRSKGGTSRSNADSSVNEESLSLARRLSVPPLNYPLSLSGLGGNVLAPYSQLGMFPPASGYGLSGLGGPTPFLSTSRSRLLSAINTAAAALDVIRQEEAEILRRANV